MKLTTFYKIYYRHRFKKASFVLKIYLILIVFFKYILNLFYLPKKKNLDNYSKENQNLFDQDLNYLCEYFNSDKGEKFKNQYAKPSKQEDKKIIAHGYAKIYEKYLKEHKDEYLNIIELGSFYGNASAAFYFYFKNAQIYSADINPDMYLYRSKRLKNFFTDTSSRTSIEKNILSRNIEFDLIIEDASHMLKDQIISLFILFKNLKPGGFFIIEEIDFPEKREDMRVGQEFPDLKTILNKIINKENFNSKYINENEKKYFLENFDTIKFYTGNINEIAIIKKK
tara:strand:+ start:230 stop:1078 length:849 start_codon:yes stop_codon:yes gene_type:complete